VNDAERAVAVRFGRHDHAEGEDIGELGKTDRFALQLAPDRIGMLLAAEHAGADAGLLQLGRDLAADHRHRLALAGAQRVQPAHDRVARYRIEVRERQLLQLDTDAVAADRAGERGVDLQRLTGDPLTFGRTLDEMQGTHVVQPVGELDQQHTDVLGDRQDEFAQVLGLPLVFGGQRETRKLSDALDQLGDLLAEHPGDLVTGDLGVLDHVVQQRGDDGRGVHPVVGEDAGDFDRMGEIGVARGAHLRAVRAHGVDVGAIQQRLVRGRIIGLDPIGQLVLAQELARAGRSRPGRSGGGRAVRKRDGRREGRLGG